MSEEISGKDYLVCDNCRLKKIRCGREKPCCANCTRLSLKCEWSGHGKKCNQTTLLTHTIIGLSSRLENLEASVLNTQNSLKRYFEEPAIFPTSLTSLNTDPGGPIPEILSTPSPRIVTGLTYARPLGRLVIEKSGGRERCFSPLSPAWLMLDIMDIVTERIGGDLQELSEYIEESRNKLELLIFPRQKASLSDGTPPTLPPFSILDAMIDPYFANHNQHLPIWRKEKFIKMANDLRYSEFPERDHASIMCCNNLILLTLTADSLRSSRGRPAHTRKRSSIDFDIAIGFLANAKQAIESIELLLSPGLLNLQALLSLCAVAQEHLSPETFQYLFALAIECAKSVGVDQWESHRNQLSDEDVAERKDICYCLHILDKVICCTSGTFPTFARSYVNIGPITVSPDDSSVDLLHARARLATIEETVYHEIYASQVQPRTENQVYQVARELLNRLQNWLTAVAVNLSEVESATDCTGWKIELAVHFLCAQLRLIWPYKNHPEAMFQQRTDISRRCIQLLLRLWDPNSTEALHSSLPRILASQPPLYLHEISVQILQGTGTSSDAELIRNFTGMLRTITQGHEERSYNKQLFGFSNFVMKVVDITNTRPSAKRPRIVESNECLTPAKVRSAAPGRGFWLSTPISATFPSSYNISTNLTSPLLVAEDQYLEDFDLSNWGDTFGLMTPAASGPSEAEENQAESSATLSMESRIISQARGSAERLYSN
ncbi:hypothetical protein BKA66DRAFT_443600 [Pyrenochaeta sp. MPI-SDFR-AT-0127]|nr:hypothetical protein BKA66DRAFT_443600 [Pyrenochaeta sp. MPI-SDFR-AT-0127]